MTKILFIAHAPSPNTARLRDASSGRIRDETDIQLDTRSPFDCSADDALSADGIIIGTIENIGAMAGATKDFFDRSYNDLMEVSAGKPVAVYIRAGHDGTGTKRGIESILSGLRWRLVAPPLILRGDWDDQFPDEAAELALTLAAGVEMKLF
jgi:hypothetical protein